MNLSRALCCAHGSGAVAGDFIGLLRAVDVKNAGLDEVCVLPAGSSGCRRGNGSFLRVRTAALRVGRLAVMRGGGPRGLSDRCLSEDAPGNAACKVARRASACVINV